MRIKAIYKKNLKMSEGKVAAQIAHAVKNLGMTPTDCDIIVLRVSKTKFDEMISEHISDCYIQVDKGLTEIESGTATAAAWIEINESSKKCDICGSNDEHVFKNPNCDCYEKRNKISTHGY